MPKSAEICEVRTDGGTFRDWTTVSVTQSFDRAWERSFRLTLAEPSQRALLRLKPSDRVDISLAGQVVIEDGHIYKRDVAFDANRHGVLVEGYSKADLTMRSSADAGTGQFRGYTLDAIANRVLKPYGLKFRFENPPDGAQEKFPNVAVRYGETPFELISRLASQRGCWLRADPDGTIVAGKKADGGAIKFEEGVNILSATCQIIMPSVARIIVTSQQPGSDSLFGKKASEVQAKSEMSGGPKGTAKKVLAEMPLSQKELQLRTNMEAQAIESSLLRVGITYQGWLNPAGRLWNLTDSVSVKSPMLFPTESGQMDLKLWGYTYTQDAQGGTVTSIDLVNAKAFAIQYPDAAKTDGFYNQPVTTAQPETPT